MDIICTKSPPFFASFLVVESTCRNMLGKMDVPCTPPECTWHLLPCFIFQESDQIGNGVLLLYMGWNCPTSTFHPWQSSKSFSCCCRERLSTLQTLSLRRNVSSPSLHYCYFHGTRSDCFNSLVPQVQTLKLLSKVSRDKADNPQYANKSLTYIIPYSFSTHSCSSRDGHICRLSYIADNTYLV